MENASKALIIAGAILLSILIISLGIMVYSNAKGTINNANLNSEEAQTFNEKISAYCGIGKSNADMNGLISAIAASNGAQSKLTNQHYIGVTVNGLVGKYTGTGSITNEQAQNGGIEYPVFSAGITYKASFQVAADGYINQVTISQN